MIKKKNVVLFLVTLAIVIATTFIRHKSIRVDAIVMFLVFGFTGYFLSRRYSSPLRTAISIAIYLILLYTLAWFLDNLLVESADWNYFSIGTINFLLGIVGAISGVLLASMRVAKWCSIGFALLMFSFTIWFYISLFDNWKQFIAYNNFTGKTEEILPEDWYITIGKTDTIRANDLKGKTIVLDFWNTSCGFCFKEFPKVEAVNDSYKNKKDFGLYAVNIPVNLDTSDRALAMIQKRGYRFPVAMGNKSISEKLQIKGFPTVLIIHNNAIVFRGNIDMAQKYLKQLLR